jgi:diphthine-ammonia ligase
MKVVGLVSGGKDSCYAMWLAAQQGHEIVALANLLPQDTDPDELDSYMFQTVNCLPGMVPCIRLLYVTSN